MKDFMEGLLQKRLECKVEGLEVTEELLEELRDFNDYWIYNEKNHVFEIPASDYEDWIGYLEDHKGDLGYVNVIFAEPEEEEEDHGRDVYEKLSKCF